MASNDSDSMYGDSPSNSSQQISTGEAQTRTSSTTESGVERTSRSFYKQNMPQPALEALLKLIGQLETRTVVDPRVDAQYPLLVPQRVPTRTGYTTVYTDPRTGQKYNENEALRINAERKQIRDQYTTVQEGGTPEMQFYNQARKDEIARDRAQQDKYSKEAAMVDAKNLSGYFQRQMLEKLMPTINASAEGAGTSKGSMRALQSQRAGEVTAEQAAALGAQLSTQYGNIWANLANTLEDLTKLDPNTSVTHLLLRAIEQSRGAQEFGSEAGQTNKTRTSNTTEVSQGVQNKQIETTYDDNDSDIFTGYVQESQSSAPAGSGSGWYEIRTSEAENPWADWDPNTLDYEEEVTF